MKKYQEKILGMNKKALSEMIAYVMIIVIAVSISAITYGWLKQWIFRPTELKCREGASLIIEDYSCSQKNLNLTLRNMGKFSVDGFIIMAGNDSKRIVYPLKLKGSNEIGDILFTPNASRPGEAKSFVFDYAPLGSIASIKITPYMTNKIKVLCEEAITKQDIAGCN